MEKKVFHCLFDQNKGTETGVIEGGQIHFTLPGSSHDYHFALDERDQRCLVVFDGEALYGGFDKNYQVLYCQEGRVITAHERSMRKDPLGYHVVARPHYVTCNNKKGIEIFRYAVLLPAGRAVMRQYRSKSLSPIYVTIEVLPNTANELYATFLTTSY